MSVVDVATQRKFGSIVDFAATTGQVYPKVVGLIVNIRGKKDPVYIPWSSVHPTNLQKKILIDFCHHNLV